MDILASIESLATNPIAKLGIQAALGQSGATLSKIYANAAVDFLASGADAVQAVLDGFEQKHPQVEALIGLVRSACSGVVHIPTEDEIFHGLKWQINAVFAALSPTASPSA